ncbi:MAG: DUF2299 family protein [Candidatus Thorarchaeota archaeon]
MSKDLSEKLKNEVKEWFSSEGIKVESISNPRAEFLFKVKYMRFFFTVVRPNERNYLQVESQVMISPQHLKVLTAEKMKEFQMKSMKFSFTNGITLGFIQPRPGQQGPKPPSDRLWQTMRKLHGTVDMIITILNEITGMGISKPPETTDSGPSYYT